MRRSLAIAQRYWTNVERVIGDFGGLVGKPELLASRRPTGSWPETGLWEVMHMDNEYNKLSSKHPVSSTRCALAKLLVLLSDLPKQI
jgi:hypothetical protein